MFIQPQLLKPEELGLTRILIACATLISTILPLGVTIITVKFFPLFRNEEKQHHGFFGLILLFPLLGTVICGVLIHIFKDTIIYQYASKSKLFVDYFELLLPLAVVLSFNMALNSYSASLFKTTLSTLFEGIISRVLFILLIILYYFKWINFPQFIYLFVGIYLIQVISMFIYIYKIDKPSIIIDRLHLNSIGINKLVKFGLMFTLASFASIGLKHLDTIMIGKYLSLSDVAVFSVSAYIALVMEIPLSSLERITNFKVSQSWANNDLEDIKTIYYQSVKYLMLLGGLLLVGITLNINDLLSLLPKSYQKGSSVAIIACIGGFLNVSTGVNTSVLFTSDKYRYGSYSLFFLFFVAFGLNVILIPKLGIMGAALATALSMILYNLFKFLIIWKFFKLQPYNLSSFKILLIIITVFVICSFIPNMNNAITTMIIKSSAITIFYIVLTYWLKVVPEFHKYIPLIGKK